MKHPTKKWMGSIPEKCDICHSPLTQVFVDGRLRNSTQWAMMCPECFMDLGVALGTGFGQRYELNSHNEWVKTGG